MAKFIVTTLGHAAANIAEQGGPTIKIAYFRIGSDYATPAESTDDGLKGVTLYEGVPNSFTIENNAVAIRLEIPAAVGPFEFGEIGLYLADGTMYARCSFGKPQQKLSSVISGMPNVWRFKAILKLAQSPALFSVQTTSQNQLLEVDSFVNLGTPLQLTGAPNAVIVKELSPFQEDILVWKTSDTRWAIGKYNLVGQAIAQSGSGTGTIVADFFAPLTSNTPRTFLVQNSHGDIRGVDSLSTNVASLSSAYESAPTTGEVFDVYMASFPGFVVPQVTNTEYNRLANLLNSFIQAPYGTSELNAGGIGQTLMPILTPPNGYPSQAQWDNLLHTAFRIGSLLKLPGVLNDSQFNSDWNLSFIQRTREYNSICHLIESISLANLRVPLESTTPNDQYTITRTTSWAQVSLETEFNFGSDAVMKAYFNAGGWTGFRVDITPDNYVQSIQEVMTTQLGYICMRAANCLSTGPMKIDYHYGDGDLTDPGNAGFYGLTSTYKRIFQHRVPTGMGDGLGKLSGLISLIVSARISGTGKIAMMVELSDSSLANSVNHSNGGTLTLDGVCATGRPDAALVNSPGLTHPTVTVLGTHTHW